MAQWDTVRHFKSYKSQARVQKWHKQFGHLTERTHAQGLWQKEQHSEIKCTASCQKELGSILIQGPMTKRKASPKMEYFFPQQFRSLTCQLHTQQTFNTLLIPSNLQSETNCYHLTGVIIFPTHTMHYQRGKIPQNHLTTIHLHCLIPKNG